IYHLSLDTYAFIALTGSALTLCDLIEMQEVDATGHIIYRKLNVSILSINTCYGAIHPEHFLPCGSDRCLRKSFEPQSNPLPAFHHTLKTAAKVKFHRYLQMITQNPPTTPLPNDVLNLMHLTVKLVDLLYWKPVPTKGSPGEPVFIKETKYHQRNLSRTRQSNKKFDFPADMNLETRKAYGRALMSGHDRDYDPALFENAIPINDSIEKVDVEAWRQNISSET
ncbi:hypothetical protein BGY98DRAFT_994280, partial [Russula aff. rugulosa BPL654]